MCAHLLRYRRGNGPGANRKEGRKKRKGRISNDASAISLFFCSFPPCLETRFVKKEKDMLCRSAKRGPVISSFVREGENQEKRKRRGEKMNEREGRNERERVVVVSERGKQQEVVIRKEGRKQVRKRKAAQRVSW